MDNHKRKIHSEGRLRRRWNKTYPKEDFWSTKYDSFFNNPPRCPEEGKTIDVHNIIIQDFDFIYKGKHMNKLFSHPKSYDENPILKNLYDSAPFSDKQKNSKSCDEVFYEYLHTFKTKTNEKYFSLLVKFILLFRECYEINESKKSNKIDKKDFTEDLPSEGLPDLCNDFYVEFMDSNDFFGLDENDKNEIIEIILHFCYWLFKNKYIKSKLLLAY